LQNLGALWNVFMPTLQNFTLNWTHALRGAPGERNVTLCAGAFPAYGPLG
jgi:hypothetical protein